MQKQFFSIIMAGLIALSSFARAEEPVPVNPEITAAITVETPILTAVPAAETADQAVSTALSAAAVEAAIVDTPVSATTTAIQAVDRIAVVEKILVPFDQKLYKEFCQGRRSAYGWGLLPKLITLVVGAATIGSQVGAIATNPQAFFTLAPFKKSIADYLAYAWYWKIGAVFTQVIPSVVWKTIQAGICYQVISSTVNAAQTMGSDWDQWNLWEEHENLEIVKQSNLWHKEVLTCFGNPEIIGTTPVTGKYLLKCYKRYGAGYVIFDPFDAQQVKILLGVHDNITEDLRCYKIEVIVEEIK